MTFQIPGTNIKAVSLESFPPEAWDTYGRSGIPNHEDAIAYASYVGTLYRCIDIRSESIAQIPWSIRPKSGGDAIYESAGDTPPDSMAWLDKLPDLLSLTESSLCFTNTAWWFIDRNRARVNDLKWFAPMTMDAIWDQGAGLIAHDRTIDGQTKRYPVDDGVIAYIWRQSSQHETEPRTPPVVAAMSSAGVLFNLDALSTQFFKRGAIKTTILTVEGSQPDKTALKELLSKWKRVFSGVGKAYSTEYFSDKVKPVAVGEGIGDLDSTQISEDKRHDIAVTMGVAPSMLFANAANYATAEQDEKNFWKSTILPSANLIKGALNRQLFDRQGLRFEWHPNTMDVFQTDENERSQSFAIYVGAGIKHSVAAEMLGLELPESVDYADLDPEPAQEMPTQPEPAQGPPAPAASDDDGVPAKGTAKSTDWHVEAAKLRRWIEKRRSNGQRPGVAKFRADHLSADDKAAIFLQVIGEEDAAGAHDHGAPIKAMQIGNPAIDPQLRQYEADLADIIGDAVSGEDDKPEFERRMRDVVLAALLAAFLAGIGADDESELSDVQAAALRAARNRSNESVTGLSDDIYNADRYAPVAPGTAGRRPQTDRQGMERAVGRVGLWVTALAGMFAAGQLRQQPDKRFEWQLGNTVEHCSDCQRLNGQVHSSEAWLASGYQPQGHNLECGGWNCDCKLEETDAEDRGGF